MEKIIWVDIYGFKGEYQISNNGDVKSLNRIVKHRDGLRNISERILKISVSRGYKFIALFKNGKGKSFLIHRLVAEAFIKNPENKPQVNHIDGNKLNNHVSNLEWCTSSENGIHAYKTGLQIPTWKGKFGKDNKDSKPVEQYSIDGIFIRLFNGISEASRITGVSITGICDVCNGRKKHAKNFIWKHAH